MSHLSLAGSKSDFLHGINGEASNIIGINRGYGRQGRLKINGQMLRAWNVLFFWWIVQEWPEKLMAVTAFFWDYVFEESPAVAGFLLFNKSRVFVPDYPSKVMSSHRSHWAKFIVSVPASRLP